MFLGHQTQTQGPLLAHPSKPHWPPPASMPGAEEYLPHHNPHPRPRPKLWPWARPPPHLLPAWPSVPSLGTPGPGQPPPTSRNRTSSQTSPRGLANPLDHKEKDPRPFPTELPLPLPRRVQEPLVHSWIPRAPPGGHWGPKHGPLFGRAGRVGHAARVSGSFSAGNLRVQVGVVGEGRLAAPSDLTLHGA